MKKNSVAKNYVYNLIYQMLTIISPIIAMPYLSRVLGVNNLGIHGYTVSVVTYFILFGSLGVNLYGQREIAYVQNNELKQIKTFWEIVFIRFVTYIIALICFYLTFCIHGKYILYYKILIFEMIANSLDIVWYFQGREEFNKTVIRNLIIRVLSLILIFTIIKSKNDLYKYFIIYVLSDLLGNISLWFYIIKDVFKKVPKLEFRKHLRPIFLLFLPQIAIQIYAVLDKTMVGVITNNMSDVGYYDLSQKLVKALLIIVTALGIVMNSRIANAFSKRKIDDVKKYLLQSINMIWLVAVPFVFGIMAISEKMVPWYFGSKYLPVIPLMKIMAPILIIIGLNNVTGIQYLIQIKKQKEYTLSVIFGAIINVIFNYILITKYGVNGAAYSTLIAESVVLIVQLFYVKNVISAVEIFRLSIKYIISGVIMYIIVKFICSYLSISILNTLIETIIGAFLYIIILIFLKDKFFIGVVRQVLCPLRRRMKISEKNTFI